MGQDFPDVGEVRADLNRLQQDVASLATSVEGLTHVSKTTNETVDRLAEVVRKLSIRHAEQSVDRGISGKTIFTSLSLLAVWTGIVAALVVQHVNGKVQPIIDNVASLTEAFNTRMEKIAIPEADTRLSTLENEQRAMYAKNKTQYRWMADIVNSETDWMQRWMSAKVDADGSIVLPPRGYTPLKQIGEGH